ncbi:MAG: DUF1934 family protein [Oscillospiraceae bacterium]|nr:DUF1934 family protein [Oscillospiraceae bacterium]
MRDGGNFNFRVKISQTDLSGGGYHYDYSGESYAPDSIMYDNSEYISKLFFINNISGGILAKERVEDMPEKYRRFVSSDITSGADIIKSIKKELTVLANREEVGQNVFYSSLAGSAGRSESEPDDNNTRIKSADGIRERISEIKSEIEDIFGEIRELLQSEQFKDLSEEVFSGLGDGEFDEFEDYYEDFEDYDYAQSGEEIRDILHLNNYYNSETYKMSDVKYDFSCEGSIKVTDDGSLDIIYDESEMTGFKDSYCRFVFNMEKKDIITMSRKGFFETWLTLEKGGRVSTEYGRDIGFATAAAKEIVNNMTPEGGRMHLVYVTETNGFPSEMITHTIFAEPSVNVNVNAKYGN